MEHTVLLVDPMSKQVVARVGVDITGHEVAVLTPDGTRAYVSCPQGGTIEILNLKDWKLEEPIRLTKGVDGMAWLPSATN